MVWLTRDIRSYAPSTSFDTKLNSSLTCDVVNVVGSVLASATKLSLISSSGEESPIGRLIISPDLSSWFPSIVSNSLGGTPSVFAIDSQCELSGTEKSPSATVNKTSTHWPVSTFRKLL